MAGRPKYGARRMPAQTMTVVGNAEWALSTVESELLADGWRERVRVTPTGVVYETGSAARALWLGGLLPMDLLPKRVRRSAEHALAAVHADQQGEHAVIDVAILWEDTESIARLLQDEFRAAVDRAIRGFHAAGVLVSVGPVVSAYTLPPENFCSPANRRHYLRAGAGPR